MTLSPGVDTACTDLLLNLSQINVRISIIAIEDLRHLFKRWTFGLYVDEVDPDELDDNPEGVEEGEVPGLREIFEAKWVGLAVGVMVSKESFY